MKLFHTYSEDKQMKQDKELKYNASGYYDPTAFEALTRVQKGEESMEVLKGDIYFLERNGKSDIPVVIVSNNIGNHFSDYVNVVYMANDINRPMPTHVELNCRGLSTAMCEQIHCVKKERLTEFVRSCTDTEINKLDAALMLSCGIKYDKDEIIDQLQYDNQLLDSIIKQHESHVASLQEELKDANEIIENMKISDSQPCITETDSIKVIAERDLYKNLYEQLLERMMDQKAG